MFDKQDVDPSINELLRDELTWESGPYSGFDCSVLGQEDLRYLNTSHHLQGWLGLLET